MCIDPSSVAAVRAAVAASLVSRSVGLPPAWREGGWSAGPERFGIESEFEVAVRMSDKVVLKAAVAYPTDLKTGARAAGPFPVLLEQSPYHRQPAQDGIGGPGWFPALTRYFVSRGYICVSAQVRGTHRSGGEFGLISEREQQDGVELVDWVAHRLEGSNGRVGLTGCSYTGLNQYFTAALVGPDSPVKAIVPTGVGPDWYREPGFVGGAPTVSIERTLAEVWSNAGTESAVRFNLGLLSDIKAGGDAAYRRGFWQARSAANVIGDVVRNGVPALIIASWNDYPTSPAEAYVMFQNAFAGRDVWAPMASDQNRTGRYQLIMCSESHCEGRDSGPMAEATLRWFDTWVKEIDTGLAAPKATMHLNDLGSDRWMSGGAYPPVAKYRTYYLHADGELSATTPDATDASDRVCYASPVFPEASLTYTTPPFAEGALLAGPIAATIFATSTGSDILIIADVFDVAPDGVATQIATGGLIGSHRTLDDAKTWRDEDGRLIRPFHRSTDPAAISPGEVVRLDIQIQPRVASLAPGHRLRLVLKTQSDPTPCTMLFPNGQSFWCLAPTVTQRCALEGAVFDVQRSRTHASLINIPLA